MLLQVWMVCSTLYTQQYISKPEISGTTSLYLWYPIEIAIPYLVAIVLFGLMPGIIRYAINFFIFLCGLSAFVAILQAAHFPPAIHIADFYVYRSIEGWDNVSGIRASGLTNNPNTSVLGLMIAASLIAYKAAKRRLHWYDWTLWSMFLIAAFVAQHRSSMPIIAATFIATALVMGMRRPKIYVFLFGGAAVCLLLAMTVGKHVFSYTFETDWTNAPELQSRVDEEKQAWAMYLKQPFFGVGPAPEAEGIARSTTKLYDYKIENLWASTLFTLGAPGFAILATMYITALVLAFTQFLNRRLPYPARVMALGGSLGAFALIVNGNAAVNITQFHIMFPYMVLMAFVQSSLFPYVSTRRRVRVSPYLQPGDRAKASNALASIN
jgi:hypothetical protein